MSKMKADYELFYNEEDLKQWLNSNDLNNLNILSMQYIDGRVRPWIIFYTINKNDDIEENSFYIDMNNGESF
jgi:hypothetical protein